MAIGLVVFDMAGTTVYDGDAVNVSLRAAIANAGVEVTRDEVNEVMGIAKPLAIKTLMERKSADVGDVTAALVEKTHDDFLRRMIDYYKTDPAVREILGASDVFRMLKAAGIHVALDTGFSRPIADVILERLNWNDPMLIDVTVTPDEVERGRPHPDMIRYAMTRTGVASADSVAKVGDTPSDLHEGTNAGCALVIGVTEGSHTREQLQVHPHTHLIRTVAELPALLGIAS